MVTCDVCKGEGKVKSLREKSHEGLLFVLGVCGVLAIAPTVTSIFYGFAFFISWLTESPMRSKNFSGEVSLNSTPGMLTFIGALLGVVLTAAAIVAWADSVSKEKK